jgi:lipopolysaccharide transport system permease protein
VTVRSVDAGRVPRRGPGMSEPIVIEPRGPTVGARLRELWQYRALIPYFWKRFLEKRYLRTWLGWIWVPLRPIADTAARVFVFGTVLGVPSEGVPYLVFLLVGMSAWGLLDETLYYTSRALDLNRSLLSKLYVPRLTMLIGSTSIGGVNFLVYVVITAIVMAYYAIQDGVLYFEVSWSLLIAVAGLLLIIGIVLALGLWLSVLGAQARDVRFSLRYVTTFWFFLTPVLYPASEIPDRFRWLLDVNPAAAPIEMVKEGVLGVGSVSTVGIVSTLVFIVLVGAGGFWFFGRAEAAAMDNL